MGDFDDRDVWAVKRILESGDPDRMDTEAQTWREAEAMLDTLEHRMKYRIELLSQHVSGGGFAVLSDEYGMLQGHVRDLRFNAQSNGVGWKGIADTLREARPKVQQVAADYESTVVSPDGFVTASTTKAASAGALADQRARQVMSSANDRFQQVYANTSSEPPPYQGPGDTGKTYRPGSEKGSPVDPVTGRYVGDTSSPYNENYRPPAPTTSVDNGPRTEFPTPGPTSASGPIPSTPMPNGPWGTGLNGTGPGSQGGAGWPFSTPISGPAGTLPGNGTGPLGQGVPPGGASGRTRMGRSGAPMSAGPPGPGGAHGTGRPSGTRQGSLPGGRPLPGRRSSSVYGSGQSGSVAVTRTKAKPPTPTVPTTTSCSPSTTTPSVPFSAPTRPRPDSRQVHASPPTCRERTPLNANSPSLSSRRPRLHHSQWMSMLRRPSRNR